MEATVESGKTSSVGKGGGGFALVRTHPLSGLPEDEITHLPNPATHQARARREE